LNRLPDIGVFDEYNQWKESLPGTAASPEAEFSGLPSGFVIDRIAEAGAEDGSWISLAFEPTGGILVAREDQGLVRVTLPEEAGELASVRTVEETLQECRGLLWAHGALYAHANRSGGLFRLRDRDGDGRYEERTLLRKTPGRTGHGRNDLALGPDGWIYAICGDDVEFPEGARDATPREPGGALPLGHLARTDPEGRGWEVLCRGLRNPYGIDFNRHGEAFTFDADNEGDVGLPFYRPTRVNHLVPGANYGWLQGPGPRSWPVHAADSLPTTFDIGRGSPTAIRFGSRSHFPPRYRDALFLLDWAYGRILAVRLQPRGGSYHAAAETFLRGRPLNVADLEFAPDGSLVFVTGGRKTQSALYRIRAAAPGTDGEPPSQEVAKDPWEGHRKLRRDLETSRAEGPDDPAVARAWDALGHPDPWIRHAARVALERWPTRWWQARLDGERHALRHVTGALALARSGDEAARLEAVRQLAGVTVAGWRRPEKLAALRVWDLAVREPDFPSDVAAAALRAVRGWERDVSPEVRREALALRVRLQDPQGVEAALRYLAGATSQPERLHALDVLSRARAGWSPETRRATWTALDHAARFSRGDRNLTAFFGQLREDFRAGTNAAEHPEFFVEEEAAETVTAAEPMLERAFVSAWTTADFADVLREGGGNAERGARWFEEAWCGQCHMFGTRGKPVGPDLTLVGGRFSQADLLRAILEPSHVVAEPYRITVVTLRDGTVVAGRVVQDDFRESKVRLATDGFDLSKQTTVHKGDIARIEESVVSPMPPGLLDRFAREEVLDLLAYLRTGGER
jgi:putative heme-binding domain-containing protein